MKKLFILSALVLFALQGFSQQLMPAPRTSFSNVRTQSQKTLIKIYISEHLQKTINSTENTHTKDSSRAEIKKIQHSNPSLKTLKAQISSYVADSLAAVQDSLNEVAMENKIDELNESPDFIVSGIGGVSNLETIGQAGGNFAIAATFRLGRFNKIGQHGWLDPAYLYMAFNTRTASSEDTGSITKSFLFPDISKRDFVIGTYFRYLHPESGWTIDPTVEFSLNRYKITKDSISKSFRSESGLIGIKFSKTQSFNIGGDSTYEASFFLYPYYSIINVQPKNFQNYHDVITTENVPATLHAIGLQAGLTISKLQLFANMKYVLNRNDDKGLADLQGFTYTIGTIIGVDILKFKLGK